MLDRKGSFLVSSFCRLAKIYEFHGRPRTRVASALRSFYVIVVIITIATCKYYFLLPFHRVTNLLSQFFPPFFFCACINRGLVGYRFFPTARKPSRFGEEFCRGIVQSNRGYFSKLVHISLQILTRKRQFFPFIILK